MINVIKIVLLMFLIAYTSLQILNRTVLVLLGTLGGYILRFPQKQHEFYSNVTVKWIISWISRFQESDGQRYCATTLVFKMSF